MMSHAAFQMGPLAMIVPNGALELGELLVSLLATVAFSNISLSVSLHTQQ